MLLCCTKIAKQSPVAPHARCRRHPLSPTHHSCPGATGVQCQLHALCAQFLALSPPSPQLAKWSALLCCRRFALTCSTTHVSPAVITLHRACCGMTLCQETSCSFVIHDFGMQGSIVIACWHFDNLGNIKCTNLEQVSSHSGFWL